MKSFLMKRGNKPASTLIVELSFWDITKLLFGRELYLANLDIILRQQHAYDLLNMKAPSSK